MATKRHLFCRWDDPTTGERFNIEGSGEGFNSFSDDEYRRWPMLLRRAEEIAFGYLISKSPHEELAGFIAERAYVHCDHHRYEQAIGTFVVACDLTPQYKIYPSVLRGTLQRWRHYLEQQTPDCFPRIRFPTPTQRKWPSVPWEIEREHICLVLHQDLLLNPKYIARWWQPLREGLLVNIPKVVTSYNPNY